MASPVKSPAKTQLVLEINLISAQSLKPPSSPRRNFQTYALTWIDSSTKLRTRVDKIGGQNPTWNDKFLFRITPEFLASETSGVSVAIYAVGTFRDHLVGTVRFSISNILSSSSAGKSCWNRNRRRLRWPEKKFQANLAIMITVMRSHQWMKKGPQRRRLLHHPKRRQLKEWNGVRELAAGNKGLADSDSSDLVHS
jgi:hypothetical protein